MLPDPYLTRSILIAGNRVYLNGVAQPGPQETLPPLEFLDALYKANGIVYPKYHKMDPLAKTGFLAAEILLKDQPPEDLAPEDTGIVLSNSVGSLEVDRLYARTMRDAASPALFVYTLPNIVIGEMAIRHRFKGENAFFEFPAFDGKFIAEYVRILFDQSQLRRCVCGWVDFLDNRYRVFMALVENRKTGLQLPLSAENLDQLNNTEHG